MKESQGSCCHQKAKAAWYQNKTVRVAAVLTAVCLAAVIFPVLEPFRAAFLGYLRMIWVAVLVGLFLGGIIEHFVPREYVAAVLARPGRRSIVHAVLLGFLMSACSHGILALAIQLHKKGAATPSVVAFLLASPWANLPLTIMLIGFFGIGPALYIILGAVVIALITGWIYQWLQAKGWVERNAHTVAVDSDFSVADDLHRRLKAFRWSVSGLAQDARGVLAGAVSLGNMVLWWILIGMGLAAAAGAYIPAGFFHQYMGPSPLGLMVTLIAATVMEVCSEGTAPLAFEIFRQTGALGNSFVFLMAGVATDYTEIGLLWQNVGRKTALWLPVITVPQIILLGLIANLIF